MRYFSITKTQSTILSGTIFLLVSIFSAGNLSAHSDEEIKAVKKKFVGHYELISFIQFPAQAEPINTNYIGRLTYDAYGHMSGLGMPKDLPDRTESSSEQPGQRTNVGFAYWGDVSFDLDKGIVIHHVKGSPTRPQWVGEDNIRYFELTDEYLKLSLKNSQGRITSTLTWRKLD